MTLGSRQPTGDSNQGILGEGLVKVCLPPQIPPFSVRLPILAKQCAATGCRKRRLSLSHTAQICLNLLDAQVPTHRTLPPPAVWMGLAVLAPFGTARLVGAERASESPRAENFGK